MTTTRMTLKWNPVDDLEERARIDNGALLVAFRTGVGVIIANGTTVCNLKTYSLAAAKGALEEAATSLGLLPHDEKATP